MATDKEISRVGVIGLGKMGLPMARHLMGHGFETAGFDTRAEAMAAARELGIALADSPADIAARSDLAIVMVAFDSQVDHVLFGPDGVLAGVTDGLVVAVSSTVPASFVQALPARAEAAGRRIDFIDIPVTGAEKLAEDGALLVLGGGDEAVFERCRPALDAFSRKVLHLGALGAGQVTKMVNNQILWACVSANYEGMKLAESLGVDPEAVRQALLQSSACNWALETRADERPLPWAEKDMMVVLKEADAARVSLPLSGTVKEVIKGFKIDRGLPIPGLDE